MEDNKRNWDFSNSEIQDHFFEEYNAAAKLDGFAYGIVDGYPQETGVPECVINEIKEFLRPLHTEIQFLIADGLISFFCYGKREYTGLKYVDKELKELFTLMEQYVTPKVYKEKE